MKLARAFLAATAGMLCANDLIGRELKSAEAVEVVKPYTKIAFSSPRSPRVVNLGNDQFMLGTTTGVQRWDAKTNQLSEARGWPEHWALGGGVAWDTNALIGASRHDKQDQPQNSLLVWNAKLQKFSAPLPIPPGRFASGLIPINPDHALVCLRHDEPGKPFSARIIALRQGQISWATENVKSLQPALLSAGIRGEVEGIGDISGQTPPVFFNTRTCSREITVLPDELKHAENLSIKHFQLPDGRALIAYASWFNPEGRHWQNLRAPLLWDHSTQRWKPIANTAFDGNDPAEFKKTGHETQLVFWRDELDQVFEFLDLQSLRYTRSRQVLRENPSSSWSFFTKISEVALLSSGQAVMFASNLSDSPSPVFLIDPMRENFPGNFAYSHSRLGEAMLGDGQIFLAGGGSEWHPNNRPEIISPATRRSRPVSPMPRQLRDSSAVELADRSILIFGGLLPKGTCNAPCEKAPAQSSWRYFPKEDRWEEVPELNVRFASNRALLWTDLPRNDYVARKTGDIVYLENSDQSEDKKPLTTRLMQWRPGSAPVALAPLRQGRRYATLLELTGGRLAVLGGEAQASVVALEHDCVDCPDEYVSFGPLQDARASEVYHAGEKRWLPGPVANFGGGHAVRLANGKLFKLSEGGNYTFRAEIADAAFTRWKKLPPFPVAPYHVGGMAVAGNRVLVYHSQDDREKDPFQGLVIWDDTRGAWFTSEPPWKMQEKTLLGLTPLDGAHALVRTFDTFEIVPIPRGKPASARNPK